MNEGIENCYIPEDSTARLQSQQWLGSEINEL
jgi:hypothetical protein